MAGHHGSASIEAEHLAKHVGHVGRPLGDASDGGGAERIAEVLASRLCDFPVRRGGIGITDLDGGDFIDLAVTHGGDADDQQAVLVNGRRLTDFAGQPPGLRNAPVSRIQFTDGMVEMGSVNEAGLVDDRTGDEADAIAQRLGPDLGVCNGVNGVHRPAIESIGVDSRAHVKNAVLPDGDAPFDRLGGRIVEGESPVLRAGGRIE